MLQNISRSGEFHQHQRWQQFLHRGSTQGVVSYSHGHSERLGEIEMGSSKLLVHCEGGHERRVALGAEKTTRDHLSVGSME